MDDAEELRLLRSRVRSAAHEMCNTLGIALNYLDFLGEDIAGTDETHPVWQQVESIQGPIRRAVDTVRALREHALVAEEEAALARDLAAAAGGTADPVGGEARVGGAGPADGGGRVAGGGPVGGEVPVGGAGPADGGGRVAGGGPVGGGAPVTGGALPDEEVRANGAQHREQDRYQNHS